MGRLDRWDEVEEDERHGLDNDASVGNGMDMVPYQRKQRLCCVVVFGPCVSFSEFFMAVTSQTSSKGSLPQVCLLGVGHPPFLPFSLSLSRSLSSISTQPHPMFLEHDIVFNRIASHHLHLPHRTLLHCYIHSLFFQKCIASLPPFRLFLLSISTLRKRLL